MYAYKGMVVTVDTFDSVYCTCTLLYHVMYYIAHFVQDLMGSLTCNYM